MKMDVFGNFERRMSKAEVLLDFINFITRPLLINARIYYAVIESDETEGFCNCNSCNKIFPFYELIDSLCIQCFLKKHLTDRDVK
jgi:hypothetical protein